MPYLTTILESKNLTLINDIIHDSLLDKNEIIFEPKIFIFKIPFYSEENQQNLILIVSHVEKYKIEKGMTEGPGSDEQFNTVAYFPDKKEVWIETIYDKGISLKVKNLEISIEIGTTS
ncbi:MAG: hypothetical protein VW455_07105 [Nitrospinota bacterium]